MGVSAFGFGTPMSSQTPSINPFGLSSPGVSMNPFMTSSLYGQSPFGSPLSTGPNPYGSQPIQQILHLLQIVPQQLQHVVQLQYLQHQQIQQLQQILQSIPAQLQQMTQFGQQQPFGQSAGMGGGPFSSPWGMSPQMLGGQSGYVM
jgi:hypothetical protein